MKYSEFVPCGGCGIYLIKNILTGGIYIGQTTRLFLDRWKEHIRIAKNKTAQTNISSIVLAIRKYGVQNFDFVVLEQCDRQKLDEREKFWISVFEANSHNNYNQTAGGQNSELIASKPNYFYEIIDLLKNSTLTIKQIANKYKLRVNRIYEINSGKVFFDLQLKYPIRFLTGPKKISYEQFILIHNDIKNSTLSFLELANKYQVSTSTIKRINNGNFSYQLLEENYPLRNTKELTKQIVANIIRLLKESSLSISEIAALNNTSSSYVYKINSGIREFDSTLNYPIRQLKI